MAEEKTEEYNRNEISRQVKEILSSDNISAAINAFKTDSSEKETALEFAKSYYQFIKDVAENDLKKKLTRRSIEIKDLVANINAMLKDRDPDIFRIMVQTSPEHYTFIQNKSDSKKADD